MRSVDRRYLYIFLTICLSIVSLSVILTFFSAYPIVRTALAKTNLNIEQGIKREYDTDKNYSPRNVIVKFRDDIALEIQNNMLISGPPTLDEILKKHQVQSVRPLFTKKNLFQIPELDDIFNIHLLSFQQAINVPQIVDELTNNTHIEWAEPDYFALPAEIVPNDPLFVNQWGLSKIQAPQAWEITTGTQTTIIGIVDSGIEKTHPDLNPKIWVNPGEIAENGIDDDNNGYVDDVNGWDFVNQDKNPLDDHGHGTQVAGIVAAATDNGLGIAGLCWNCRIMPVKVMQASGTANYSDIASGILYAAQKGAKVINLSLGGYSYSNLLKDTIQTAVHSYDVVVIGGAGNDDIDTLFYPAAYDEVLAIAGTNQTDTKAVFSNYGDWIGVSAPAENITTTFLGNDWGSVNGTSFAAPFVSGLAGLLRSQYPDWSQGLVRTQIIHTADPIENENPNYKGLLGSGRINAEAALSVDPYPILSVKSTSVNDDILGRPTPGLSSTLKITLKNDWLDASDVTGTLSTIDPYLTVYQNKSFYGDIPAGDWVTSNPAYTFTVDTNAGYNHQIQFEIFAVANNGNYSTSLPITITTRSADEPVGGTILTNTVWTSDKTYIVESDVGIAPGVTLTIQAGTVIEFNENFALNVGGTLIANGTESDIIRFINKYDGNWKSINFDDSSVDAIVSLEGEYISGNILRNVQIQGASNGITCNNATPFLSNVETDGGGINCSISNNRFWLVDSHIKGDVIASQTLYNNSISSCGEMFNSTYSISQTVWSRSFGGTSEDISYDLSLTYDGGYIFSGKTQSFGVGEYDAWIVRLDQFGDTLWEKTYGGQSLDNLESIKQTADGGFVVAGSTGSFGQGNQDAWILKLNKVGEVQWQKTYGGNQDDYAHSIDVLSGGGYLFVGETNSFGAGGKDGWIVRLDETGDVVWQKTFGTSGDEFFSRTTLNTSGEYIVLGPYGTGNGWVLAIDQTGNVLWQKAYPFYPLGISQTNDNNYLILGDHPLYGSGQESLIVKIDYEGNIIWATKLSGNSYDWFVAAQPTNDGGYIAVGVTTSYGWGTDDGLIVKLDADGNVLWQKTYGGSSHDYIHKLNIAPDGSIIAAGSKHSFGVGANDYWIMKLDNDGELEKGCSIIQNSYLNVFTPTLTSSTASLVVNVTNIIPQNSTATILNTSSKKDMICSEGIPPYFYFLNSKIDEGNLSLPNWSEVRDSQIDGQVHLGNGSVIYNSFVGQEITIDSEGFVANSDAGHTISVGHGTISNTNVNSGGIILGSGTVINNSINYGSINVGDKSIMKGNNIENAPGWGIKSIGTVTITNNRVVNNGYGIQIDNGWMEGNLIANNDAIGLQISGNVTVISNTLIGNNGNTIQLISGNAIEISGNNLIGNNGQYEIENLIPDAELPVVSAQNNWWDTNNYDKIDQRIFDFYDDYSKGQVLYDPVLTGSVQTAPAYVISLIQTPENPVGIETVSFELKFNRPMDTDHFPIISVEDVFEVSDDQKWINSSAYHATHDVTSLVPRGTYTIIMSNAIGSDEINIAPQSGYTLTVDYAGGIEDTTPPLPPTVKACSYSTPDKLSATWIANDPESSIMLYSYAIGTTPGGGRCNQLDAYPRE